MEIKMGNETLIPIRILPKQNFVKSNTTSPTKKRRRESAPIRSFSAQSELQFECKICNVPLGSSSDGILHFRSLHPDKELQIECTQKEGIPSPEKRVREEEPVHPTVQTRFQRVLCTLCHFQAFSTDELEDHIQNMHSPLAKSIEEVGKMARGSGRMFSCPICLKRFIKETKFQPHTESHTVQDVIATSLDRTGSLC